MNWTKVFFDFSPLIVPLAIGAAIYIGIELDERAERKRIAKISAPTMRRLLGIE